MCRDVALFKALKPVIVLGDVIERIDARGGTTNVASGRENMTVDLTENGEGNVFTLCE